MGNDNVIREILDGNGVQFDTKSILIAHIKDDHENRKHDHKFKIFVSKQFEKGTGKITANRVRSITALSLVGLILAYLLSAKIFIP